MTPLPCLSVCLSACLFACLPVCLSACLPVCLSACLSVCLSVCLSACLSVCLSVCRRGSRFGTQKIVRFGTRERYRFGTRVRASRLKAIKTCVCVKMLTLSNLATLSALQSRTVWLLTATHPTPHPTRSSVCTAEVCFERPSKRVCVKMLTLSNLATLSALQSRCLVANGNPPHPIPPTPPHPSSLNPPHLRLCVCVLK